MSYSDIEIWGLITLLGIGTYLIRYSFLGLIGRRQLPEWALRHLRYTPVAVLPGLVAPLVMWPSMADGGAADPARLLAAGATLGIAWRQKNMLMGAVAGASTLALLHWVM